MRPLGTFKKRRGRRGAPAAVAVACLALAVGAVPASAKVNKEDFAKFINCPVEKGGHVCTYGETLSGEFHMGSKTVPISKPVILQGGLAALGTETYPLIAPRFEAEAMSKTSEPIPGGLTGVTELIGGPASATAEIAGKPEIVQVSPYGLGAGTRGAGGGITAVELPIRVHLENEVLGPNCYIGSDAEPVVLKLTDGNTHPPEGTAPLTGKVGNIVDLDKGKIIEFEGNTLVDNTFAVPAATGCGTSPLTEPVITAAVNVAAGLPSAAGKNTAVLNGNFFTTLAEYVEKYDKIKKKKAAKRGH